MRPSRMIVGEVRQEESLDLLIALNSGLPGMCSVHANSAREAVIKLCTLPLLAGENVTDAFVVPTVASCIDLVVQIGVEPDGSRRVREIVALPGRVEGGVVETEDIFTSDGRETRSSARLPATRGHGSNSTASTWPGCWQVEHRRRCAVQGHRMNGGRSAPGAGVTDGVREASFRVTPDLPSARAPSTSPAATRAACR